MNDGHDHDKHDHDRDDGHDHDRHGHGIRPDSDRRWLTLALLVIAGFMAVEVVAGLVAGSLALISDAAHMLTDAAAIALALVAMRHRGRCDHRRDRVHPGRPDRHPGRGAADGQSGMAAAA